MGGLLVTLFLGVTGIGLAFPLSILLALGRRSKMPIIKSLCVVFIEFIRGVPLITLLFTATKALNKLSGLTPSGRNNGSITFAVNNKVIKGTPRMNSIKTTQRDLIIGIFDRLPR